MLHNVRVTALILFLLTQSIISSQAKQSLFQSTQKATNEPMPLLAASQWDQNLNGGTVTFGDSVVSIHGIGKGYPVLRTHVNPFPTSGDWSASFGYRYSSTGNYGTEIRCERVDGSGVATIHQDVSGQFLALDGKQVWHISANQEWHFVVLSHHADRITASVDGKLVGDTTAGPPTTSIKIGGGMMTNPWDWNDLEVVMMRVQPGLATSTIPVSLTRPAPDPAPQHVAVQANEKTIDCLPGDTLTITGHYANGTGLVSRFLVVDGKTVVSQNVAGSEDDYSLSWTATEGQHLLVFGYILGDNRAAYIRRVTADVLPSAPVTITNLPINPVSDTAISFSTAGDAYKPVRMDVYFNGQALQSDPSHSFRVTLPISSLPKGRYPLSFDAYEDKGGHYTGNTEYIEVPERLQVVAQPDLTLENSNNRPSIQAAVAQGVSPTFVVYQVDGRSVAASSEAPFSAGLTLNDFKSGRHEVKAIALSPDGHLITSPTTTVQLTNKPDDQIEAEAEKLAKAAQEKADAKTAAKVQAQATNLRVAQEQQANIDAGFVPRAGMDVAIFRQQLAARAYHDPDVRSGQVGTVHGLAVETINGDEVTGLPITIDAIVRPGTGQTNFLAFSADDARVAAQQAAECCKMKTGQMGFRWDWSKYDLTVGYRENELKNGGPSAGTADAVAIMSAVFNIPVDSSVAMTGAINLQGQVLPVGGVVLKAEEALSDPNIVIRTLIIPDGIESIASITALFTVEPGLFVGKQIILAHSLDDVLRYTMIGWDKTGTVLRSQKIMQRGIELFGQGKDTAAMQSFSAAKRIAPENTSIDYWMTMIKAVEKVSK